MKKDPKYDGMDEEELRAIQRDEKLKAVMKIQMKFKNKDEKTQ